VEGFRVISREWAASSSLVHIDFLPGSAQKRSTQSRGVKNAVCVERLGEP